VKNVWILASNSWRENLRSRYYLMTAVFGVVLLYVSLLLGVLAADQEVRVLLDFGLGAIELMGLAAAVYGACTIILREMETKTIYLILTRPVGRGEYLLGRFLGLMLSVAVSMALMACVHLSILFMKGWTWKPVYALAFSGACLKVLICAALALFVALFSTSVPTALTIVGILWSLGHFLPEIRYLIASSSLRAATPLKVLSYLIPDLELYNTRDRLSPIPLSPGEPSVWAWLGYAAVYSGAWLGLSRLWLRKKEF